MLLTNVLRLLREGPAFGFMACLVVIAVFAAAKLSSWLGGPGYDVGIAMLMLVAAAIALVATGFRRRMTMFAAMSAVALASAVSMLALIGLSVELRALVLDPDVAAALSGFVSAFFLAVFAVALWAMVCQIVRGWPQGWATPLWVGSDGSLARRLTLVESRPETRKSGG